jgi:hypothetical protein
VGYSSSKAERLSQHAQRGLLGFVFVFVFVCCVPSILAAAVGLTVPVYVLLQACGDWELGGPRGLEVNLRRQQPVGRPKRPSLAVVGYSGSKAERLSQHAQRGLLGFVFVFVFVCCVPSILAAAAGSTVSIYVPWVVSLIGDSPLMLY